MAPNVRVSNAFRAMAAIGIPEETVRPVLKNLLNLYDKNWEHIEEENYRALADAIFESQENKHLTQSSSSEDTAEQSQLLLRDKRAQHEVVSAEKHLRDKRKEPTTPRHPSRLERTEHPQLCPRDKTTEPGFVSPQTHCRGKQKEIVLSPQTCHSQEREELNRPCLRESGTEFGADSPQTQLKDKGKKPIPQIASREQISNSKRTSSALIKNHPYNALMKPKSEPFTDDIPHFEVPIAVIHPNDSCPSRNEGIQDGSEPMVFLNGNEKYENDGVSDIPNKSASSLELANISESSSADFEIASSPLGEVKISLNCNSALGRPDFHMPSLDAVLKMVEDKCLKSYKIINPDFSIMKLMKELCQCFLDVGTESTGEKGEGHTNVTPTLDSLKKSCIQNALGPKGSRVDNLNMPAGSLNCSLNFPSSAKDLKGSQSSNSRSLVVVHQKQFTLDDVRPLHDVADISKGEERVRIPLVNEISSEPYPPSFYYIPHNIVYQNAYINFSLARIGDEDCCSNCFGDCMSSSIPCACARETGGEFAYTLEGLVTKKFLDDCISMSHDPEKHNLFYCQDCPLERSKNEDLPDQCKGHLVRKFIKECWSKCGCNKQCGNRVVQRGITCNLQVFLTPHGKGWGLRTLEDLPRGAFVCEYVGEILTNTELYERNMRSTGNERHTYPVLLDADWGSEGVLKDEEALCLDATFYGNVARFINHRCFDANLVEIPVEIEAPDHHYYHIAFFTSRKVEALEELTWDYGIDFNDHDHPVKAFRCLCGSEGCRDVKHTHS
ncbi:SET domain [Macleaya cordata]|uniref:SET domain n=1 Tax=Macleaya cordata TaxID=56857 RepID=A0A200PVS6_MACCD|nr:SET domain [Macleaya cordata]